MQCPDVLTETHKANKETVHETVHVLPQTLDPHTKLQEDTREEHEDERGDQPEEEEKEDEDVSVKGTVVQNCPTTDPQYVLHSQNPAECASVNTLAGLTNGFPQKGLLQNKYKIRVDFKVSFCTSVVMASSASFISITYTTYTNPVLKKNNIKIKGV